MKNNLVAENFLNGNEVKGSNFFSEKVNEKLVLYSFGYHFPLCVILKDGNKVFNKEGYSVTTAKHKGILARAMSGLDWKSGVTEDKNIILLDTRQLKEIINDSSINSYADYLARSL